jgi:hypothetical protein
MSGEGPDRSSVGAFLRKLSACSVALVASDCLARSPGNLAASTELIVALRMGST